jgi:hypothetical protein
MLTCSKGAPLPYVAPEDYTWSKGAPLPYVAPEDVPLLPTGEASHLLQLLLRATHQIRY